MDGYRCYNAGVTPDGRGGVFLLYYTAQSKGTTTVPCAVVYESGSSTGKQQVLTTYEGTGLDYKKSVFDYIAIAWNPLLLVANAVWTDYNSSFSQTGIYAASLTQGLYGGQNSNPTLGDLGFSNQRRIVMTGNTGHLIGYGGPGPEGTSGTNQPFAVWYSEQKSLGYDASSASYLTTDWTSPLRLDDNNVATSIVSASAPSEGVYEYASGTGSYGSDAAKKAIAVVWMEQRDGAKPYLFIRVKEFSDCESGGISDWSGVDSIQVPRVAVPVVAPLTALATGEHRYLLGWTVTFPGPGSSAGRGTLLSITYLRGGRITSTAEMQDENWGPHQGTWATNSNPFGHGFNILVDDYAQSYNGPQRLGPMTVNPSGGLNSYGSFVTVTSNETDGYGTSNPNDITQEIIFTGDGATMNSGTWVVKAAYVMTPSATLGTPGTNLGECSLIPPETYTPVGLDLGPGSSTATNDFPMGRDMKINYDRNPSVTITSTGQIITSWEHIDGFLSPMIGPTLESASGTTITPCALPVFNYAVIRTRKSMADGTSWAPTEDIISASADFFSWAQNFNLGSQSQYDRNFNMAPVSGWLRNPSITSFPKTLDDPSNSSSNDPGAAELLFWQQKKTSFLSDCTPSISTANALHERRFWQPYGGTWLGVWQDQDDPAGWGPYMGANAQRSFGIYNNGPQWSGGLLVDRNGVRYNLPGINNRGLTYGIGNEISGGSIAYTIASGTADIGAFKELGTYDSALSVNLYRSETRFKDSSQVTFKWGKVYVEDTTLGEPIREVMLHNEIPDSENYVSHDAARDSIFQTEWFNWPVSAEIKYDRLMLEPLSGYFVPKIDTDIAYDSVGDSTGIAYDTVEGTFHTDTTYVTDSSFMVSGLQMKYTVQLVHKGGHIDTIETLVYNPYAGLYITPKTVTIANAGLANDTVMLRVIGDFSGVPDADSNVEFDRETMLDMYPTYADTTIAIETGGGILPPPDTCYIAQGPYSNPSDPGANDVSILVHYCASGATISAQVYDNLGNPIGSPSTYTSDGQIWDRLPIIAPGSSGTYHIVVTVGSYGSTLNYSVY